MIEYLRIFLTRLRMFIRKVEGLSVAFTNYDFTFLYTDLFNTERKL